MPNVVHRFDAPDRFVAGTVGEPGERAFFLQARQGNRITSVACEKQQVSVLAENLGKVLDEVRRRGAAPDVPPSQPQARDTGPLDAPITEEFRVGAMTLSWEARTQLVVIELFSADPVDDEAEEVPEDAEPDADELFVVKITPRYAREFVARATALVAAGRPVCPFCLQPMDADGHVCPRANGYRRALF